MAFHHGSSLLPKYIKEADIYIVNGEMVWIEYKAANGKPGRMTTSIHANSHLPDWLRQLLPPYCKSAVIRIKEDDVVKIESVSFLQTGNETNIMSLIEGASHQDADALEAKADFLRAEQKRLKSIMEGKE